MHVVVTTCFDKFFLFNVITGKNKILHLHYHNSDVHQTYQGGDITQGTPIHKFAWPSWGGLMRSRGKSNTLFLHLQKIHGQTRQGAKNSHDPLITWPMWDHVTIWEIYRSTITRLMIRIWQGAHHRLLVKFSLIFDGPFFSL